MIEAVALEAGLLEFAAASFVAVVVAFAVESDRVGFQHFAFAWEHFGGWEHFA